MNSKESNIYVKDIEYSYARRRCSLILLYCYSNVTGIEGDAVSGEDHSDRQWSKSMLHNLHYCANKERFDVFLFFLLELIFL